MASLAAALREYGSSSDDDSSENGDSHLEPINTAALVDQKLLVPVLAAPDVLPNVGYINYDLEIDVDFILFSKLQEQLDPLRHIDPSSKELMYNPKVDELFAPTLGPECPFKTGQQRAHRNTLAGYVEPAHLSEFQFEAQRKTFVSFGKILTCCIKHFKE